MLAGMTALTVTAAAAAVTLTKVYGTGAAEVRALDSVTAEFADERFTAIMGPSGSGKSTLLHCLAGLDTPTSGQVFLGGADLGSLSDTQLTRLRRDRAGFIFQSFNLLPALTVAENIALPSLLAGRKPAQSWLDDVVSLVGLGDRLAHRPAELSGGQQQRVAVARALASQPEIIFADEPTGNLDSRSSAQLLGYLRTAVGKLGQTIVMVTHDPGAAAASDEVLFLADGRIAGQLDAPSRPAILDRLASPGRGDRVMLALRIRDLWSRKRRLAGVVIAVALGVAFLSGALTFGNTLSANFGTLFATATSGTSAVVRSATTVGSGVNAARPPIPASLLPTVRSVPGVADAQPSVTGSATLLGADGKAVGGLGPPRSGGNWISDPALTPYRLAAGRAPQGLHEVVINEGAARAGHLRIGSATTVLVPAPVRVRVVGLATFGRAPGFGGATYVAFSYLAAQRYLTQGGVTSTGQNSAAARGQPRAGQHGASQHGASQHGASQHSASQHGASQHGGGQVSAIQVRAARGVSPQVLVARLDRVLPRGAQALSGAQLTSENLSRPELGVPVRPQAHPGHLRRDRAAGRRVLDREHVRHPGRAAHPRVGPAAGARGDPGPGAARGAGRGAGRGAWPGPRWGRRPASVSRNCSRACSTRPVSHCLRAGWRSAAAPSRWPC